MRYVTLGDSGVQVSTVCLGSATFGVAPLAEDAPAVVGKALESGVNFFDAANSYGHQPRFDRPGAPPSEQRKSAEEIMGKALGRHRDEVILATKVMEPVGPGVNDRGLSRVHIMTQVEESLRRLQTDHIDIYYAHHPDVNTPIETTARAFDDLIHQGKVRYWALSTYPASRVVEALWATERLGLNPPICNQIRYNLDDRASEAEVQPTCARHNIDLTCWSPLSGGLLAGREAAARPIVGNMRWGGQGFTEQQLALAATVEDLANDWGHPSAQVALAWLLSRSAVASVIVGAETVEEMALSAGAGDLVLEAAQLEQLSALTAPAPRRF